MGYVDISVRQMAADSAFPHRQVGFDFLTAAQCLEPGGQRREHCLDAANRFCVEKQSAKSRSKRLFFKSLLMALATNEDMIAHRIDNEAVSGFGFYRRVV